MNRLKWFFAIACLVCGQASGSPVGFATAVFHEYPGGMGWVEGTSSIVVPPQSFTVADIGSGAFGGNAWASYLSLGTSVFSTATSSNDCCSNGATAIAYAVAQDVLGPAALGKAGQAGFASLLFRISGTNSATVINPGPLATSARAVVNVMSGPSVVNSNPVNITGPDMGGVYGHRAFNALEYKDSSFTVNVPIFFDIPVVLWTQLLSVAEGSVNSGGVYKASSSFDSTLVLESVQLLDSAMQPVSNPSLTSQSGTVYPLVGGADASVPEPGSVLTVAAGLFAAAVRCRGVVRTRRRWQ